MKNLLLSNHKDGGFTFIDLLIVLGTMALLVAVGPLLFRRPPKSPRINCVSNLKQVGVGFRTGANQHEEKCPCLLSTTQGGTLECSQPNEVFRHFEIGSNEFN